MLTYRRSRITKLNESLDRQNTDEHSHFNLLSQKSNEISTITLGLKDAGQATANEAREALSSIGMRLDQLPASLETHRDDIFTLLRALESRICADGITSTSRRGESPSLQRSNTTTSSEEEAEATSKLRKSAERLCSLAFQDGIMIHDEAAASIVEDLEVILRYMSSQLVAESYSSLKKKRKASDEIEANEKQMMRLCGLITSSDVVSVNQKGKFGKHPSLDRT